MSSLRRILFISPVLPDKNGVGIEKRAWAHLDALKRIGEVDLVLIVRNKPNSRMAAFEDVEHLCRTVRTVYLHQTFLSRTFRFPLVTLILRVLAIGQPKWKLQDDFSDQFRQKKFWDEYSLLFCFRISPFFSIDYLIKPHFLKRTKFVIDFDDFESHAIERQIGGFKRFSGLEQQLISRVELIETRIIEKRALKHSDMVCVCSELDASRLRFLNTASAVHVVPNSYPNLSPLELKGESSVTRILFLGALNYAPNEDAIVYFCNQILPIIRDAHSFDIDITIVGRKPSKSVLALSRYPGVNVVGEVDDVRPYYNQADFVISPIRNGGGTRIKILEALALGRPVVSTSIGAEGLNLRDGVEVLIADTSDGFARACLKLAGNSELRKNLSRNGRLRFLELYEFDNVSRGFADELNGMLLNQ